MARVSVIIPTHSRPHLLPRAVESARAAGADVEIIVVDDASIDATAEVCRTLKGIRYVRLDRNQGVAGARNVGLLASTAEYIAFLDDDDLRLPGSLDLQLEALAAHPEAGFVCGSIVLADQDCRPTGEIASPGHPGGDAFWELIGVNFPIMPISTVVRKECFLRVGLFDTRLRGIDDWDIFVRLSELYPIVILEQPVGIYRQPTPFSGQGSSALAPHLLGVARHQLRLLRLPRVLDATEGERKQLRKLTLERLVRVLLWNSAWRLPEGAYRFAFANILAALRLDPVGTARPLLSRKEWRKLVAMRRRESTAGARSA